LSENYRHKKAETSGAAAKGIADVVADYLSSKQTIVTGVTTLSV
jgi:hypothetical protein